MKERKQMNGKRGIVDKNETREERERRKERKIVVLSD